MSARKPTRDNGPARKTDRALWDAGRLADPHLQPDKAHRVRQMFDAIAPTYELINSLASFGMDASWRRRAVRLAKTAQRDAVLDVACGTGDLARAFARRAGAVVGADFAEKMLALARRQGGACRGGRALAWCRADAMVLPFADGTFNMTCCAFGVRNFQDLSAGFREMHRVLTPGGRAIVVEFSMPSHPVVRWLYGVYFEWIMPALATVISRDRTGAYRYLARSVVAFVGRDAMIDQLRAAGFARVTSHPLTLGVVVVYVAEKDS